MTSTPAELLAQRAEELGLEMSTTAAARLIHRRGHDIAVELVEAAASLSDLASALGFDLDRFGAIRRLDHARGSYDRAAKRLMQEERDRDARVNREFSQAFNRCEKALYSRDAKARHTLFLGELATGTLGWQTSMLLRAAEDAGIDADRHRAKLTQVVGAEIDRRYPRRREDEWMVVDEDRPIHKALFDQARRDENHVRAEVLSRRPELAGRIDALRSKRLTDDVQSVLRKIRRELRSRAESGRWVADPERYRREVIDAAALEAEAVARRVS